MKTSTQRGTTILEVMIAIGVLATALMGTMSLLLFGQTANEAADDSRQGHKASQEIMEQVISMDWNTMLLQNGVNFVATEIHPNQAIGTITIQDISPAGAPDTVAEITVTIADETVSVRPLNVSMTTWRTNQ